MNLNLRNITKRMTFSSRSIHTSLKFLQKVPVFISWIRFVSFNYHTYKLLLKVQYNNIIPAVNGMRMDNGVVEVTALIAMVFGYRLLAYISLRRMKLQSGS